MNNQNPLIVVQFQSYAIMVSNSLHNFICNSCKLLSEVHSVLKNCVHSKYVARLNKILVYSWPVDTERNSTSVKKDELNAIDQINF